MPKLGPEPIPTAHSISPLSAWFPLKQSTRPRDLPQHRLAALLPVSPVRSHTPCYRWQSGPLGRVLRVALLSPPRGPMAAGASSSSECNRLGHCTGRLFRVVALAVDLVVRADFAWEILIPSHRMSSSRVHISRPPPHWPSKTKAAQGAMVAQPLSQTQRKKGAPPPP